MEMNVCFVVDGLSAEEAKKASKFGAIQAQKAKAIREMEKLNNVKGYIATAVQSIMDEVQRRASLGYTSATECFFLHQFGNDMSNFKTAFPYIKKSIESLGYKADSMYEYCSSWQKKSGKIGLFIIEW